MTDIMVILLGEFCETAALLFPAGTDPKAAEHLAADITIPHLQPLLRPRSCRYLAIFIESLTMDAIELYMIHRRNMRRRERLDMAVSKIKYYAQSALKMPFLGIVLAQVTDDDECSLKNIGQTDNSGRPRLMVEALASGKI
jgi:hypothetical protein